MPMNDLAIEAHGLSFAYGSIPVLQDVDFALKSGEYLAVIGPNGGGKTTLVKLLLGLLKPTSGVIRIFGRPSSDPLARADVGYVPQRVSSAAGEFPATVKEIVASGRTPRRGLFRPWSKEDETSVSEAMRILDLESLASRTIGALSGGQRQRVFIARALAAKPRVLVLDEPTVGVDAASQDAFRAFLARAHRELGMTIVFVTHDVEFVSHEATSVLCLNHEMVCHGRPGEFLKEDFLVQLYGREVKLVEHEHDHHSH